MSQGMTWASSTGDQGVTRWCAGTVGWTGLRARPRFAKLPYPVTPDGTTAANSGQLVLFIAKRLHAGDGAAGHDSAAANLTGQQGGLEAGSVLAGHGGR